jgi:hypothetical protein
MSEPNTRQHRDWPALISEWQKSGLTKAAFCKHHGLAVSRFYAVIKKMNQAPATKAFAKIKLADKPVTPPTKCIIELPNRVSLTLLNPSSDLLRALIK